MTTLKEAQTAKKGLAEMVTNEQIEIESLLIKFGGWDS
ncbi:Uncharacterised protein [uncultured archaeon]|nr:Uncharacterised protein [uncultured archaeon]